MNNSNIAMLQLYLSQQSIIFLFVYPSNTIDSGVTITVGEWVDVVIIVNLFDIQKVEFIIQYNSIFKEISSSIGSAKHFSSLNF